MYILTSSEMRAVDAYTIDEIGIPGLVLMENAGRAAAEETAAFAGNRKRWAVLAGKGNNGADGVVAARHLFEWGYAPFIIYASDPATFHGKAAKQRDIAEKMGISSMVFEQGKVDWSQFDGLLDALLGTGSKGAPRGRYTEIIKEAGRSGHPVIALDMPSGIDADTGYVHEPCIQAVKTVALAYSKCGLEQYPALEKAGEIVVRSIGIPPGLEKAHGVRTYLTGDKMLKRRFKLDPSDRSRKADTNKGTYGHTVVAAGTRNMAGAGVMASKAALRTGSGLVTWAVPDRLIDTIAGRQPEIMLHGLPDKGKGDWSSVSPGAVADFLEGKATGVFGPGMGRWLQDGEWMRHLWENTTCPLVLDADALNILSECRWQEWETRSAPVILTPHPGEMARLCGMSVEDVQKNRLQTARDFAEERGVYLVLKGARTITASPEGMVSINPTGNPKMATGGAGDVLSGVIGALLAQGMEPEAAAVYGVYLHGQAGDRAAAVRELSASVTAGDIIEEL
jgi:ADP-dependent NAD(P)H-hydrate dehydratase / NAD(P)H-hydrate epimerase